MHLIITEMVYVDMYIIYIHKLFVSIKLHLLRAFNLDFLNFNFLLLVAEDIIIKVSY